MFAMVFVLFKVDAPDLKLSINTKNQIIKIRKLKENNSCEKLNNLLNDHEIWIMKNIYSNECSSRYDFDKGRNVLY